MKSIICLALLALLGKNKISILFYSKEREMKYCKAALALSIICSLALSGCGGGNDDPITPPAPTVSADDTNNTINGWDAQTMELSLNSGATWVTTLPDLSGNVSAQVRVKAQGINPASPITTLTFTAFSLRVIDELIVDGLEPDVSE
jgi:hypothetical protein